MKAISKNGQTYEVISKVTENSVSVIKSDGTKTIIMLAFNPLFNEDGSLIDLSLLDVKTNINISGGDKKIKRNDEFSAYMSEKSEEYMNNLKKYGK